VEESRRSFSAILSVGAMVLILALAVWAYNWFVDFNKNPPAPRESTVEPPAPNRVPAIWPEVARDLGSAASLTLYSLSPRVISRWEWATRLKGEPDFHDYLILGSAQVTSPKEAARIVTSVVQDVVVEDKTMMCFNPRHGAQVTLRDGRQIDLVICYQCDKIEVYGVHGEREYVQVHPGPSKEALDNVLLSAGVDLKDPRLDLYL